MVQNWLVIAIAVLLFPPGGLVLVWMRRQTRVIWRLLISLIVVAVAVVELFLIYGLHVEMDGSGMRPIFSFRKPQSESHYRALEKSRVLTAAPAPPRSNLEPQSETPIPAASAPEAEPARLAPAAYWTDFRGPRRDGAYTESDILTSWPRSGLRRLWAQPIGGGYASFAVADGKAFTIEQRRDQEVVAAYDIATGREIWKHGWKALFQESMGGDGPRSTPTWNEGRVYALGATGELHCLDGRSGTPIWRKNILKENDAENLTWGQAYSPLVVDDMLIVLPGGAPGKSVAAYDKLTGIPRWKALDDRQAYTSPMLVSLGGKRQILVVSAKRAMGLVPENGALLWEYPWTTEYDINAAQPIILGENRFFISAGYNHGCAVVEVSPKDDRLEAHTVWQNNRMKNRFSSSVLYQGHIYGFDEAILACIDAETGTLKWKGGRYGYGQLLLANGHLVVLSETGDVALVKAVPDGFQEVAKFTAISGKTWNVPALAQGYLLVRNETEMACFRIGAK